MIKELIDSYNFKQPLESDPNLLNITITTKKITKIILLLQHVQAVWKPAFRYHATYV